MIGLYSILKVGMGHIPSKKYDTTKFGGAKHPRVVNTRAPPCFDIPYPDRFCRRPIAIHSQVLPS